MKKVLVILMVSVLLIASTACKERGNSSIERNLGSSEKFTSEEIQEAMLEVERKFSLQDARITKIYYDEKKYEEELDVYMNYGMGSTKDIDPKDVIVIFTDLEVDNDKNEGLSAGKYNDFMWILNRNSSGKWAIEVV